MNVILQIGLWFLNGLLAILWLIADNLLILATIPLLGIMVWIAPGEQRPWAGAAAGLSLLGMVAMPFPVPALTLLMAGAGLAGHYLEKFNKPAALWTVVRGLALYGLVALGYGIFRRFFLPTATLDPTVQQGLGYLSIIASISLYIVPLGFLALVAQALFAHPPLQGTPDQIIYQYRARGKK